MINELTINELTAIFLQYGGYSKPQFEPGFGWRTYAQLQEHLNKPFSIPCLIISEETPVANNYTEVTMTPSVFLTEKQEGMLSCYGASCEPDGPGDKLRYVFWEDHFNDQPGEMDLEVAIDEGILEEGTEKVSSLEHFLRDVLLNPENKDVEALEVDGCFRCDKLRPGEFGGISLLVTRKEYAWCNAGMLKLGKGGKIVPRKIEVIAF